MPAVDLLNAGIEALAHLDVAELERLLAAAGRLRLAETVEDQRLAREKLRTLGHLIVLTRRNLRLLRGAGFGVYGPTGGRSGVAWEARNETN
jgi:predicted ABC-class ATPase